MVLVSVPAFADQYGSADSLAGHFRRYEPAQMEQLLTRAGLDDVQVVCYGVILGPILQATRNLVARRRLRSLDDVDGASDEMSVRTAASGRFMQPSTTVMGMIIAVGTWPFRLLQRRLPRSGSGLVACARRPATS
jgi:hypothetical protein